MKHSDLHKTSAELLSDSCFELLASLKNRVAAVEAKLEGLRALAKLLSLGSPAERANHCTQRKLQGELFGLAYAQGGLEAHCQMKTELAAIASRYEALA